MTEQEKFIFKTLQWFMALGVTVMLFLQGYMITFIFDTYSWKGTHEYKHNYLENYYIRRIYIDSAVNVQQDLRIDNIEKQIYKGEAIIPKKEHEITNAEIEILR